MNSQVKNSVKARVLQWNAAAPMMDVVRDNDIRHADTARAMKFFTGVVLAALPMHPPLMWSGLVEQQRCFRKLRKYE